MRKNIRKYLTIWSLLFISIFLTLSPCFAATFVDVPASHWAYEYIEAIYSNGITRGCSQNPLVYCPGQNVTRGQMAAFIIRAKYGENIIYTTDPYFSDVPPTHTFFKYVQRLKDDAMTTVIGVYGVDNPVTREQMAAFIIRAKFGENFTYTTTPYFSDVPSGSWAFKYVQKLKDERITTLSGAYMAGAVVSREQMAAFIARAFLGMGTPSDTSSILGGQTEFTGTFPPLKSVAYTTEEGDSLTAELAFEGWVTLLVTPATPEKVVKDEAAANGGTVIDAIPRIGLYTISVAQGQESAFLAALLAMDFVLYGAPASPTLPSSLVERVAIDFHSPNEEGKNYCEKYHGNNVAAVMERGGDTIKRVDLLPGEWYYAWVYIFVHYEANKDKSFDPRTARLMLKEMEAAKKNGKRVVINLSLQSIASKKGDADNIRTFCSQAVTADNLECRQVRAAQLLTLATFLAVLEYADPDVLDNTFVVISAGNAGVDLSKTITEDLSPFPNALKRAVIVGSTDTSGNIEKRDNYGSGIIYARGVDVPTLSGQTCTGTSFAAPEVARILYEMWRAASKITSAQLLDAFDDALATCPGATRSANIVPQNAGGTTPVDFVSCAIQKAQAIDSITYYTLTITKTGTGSGTVSASPPGSTYTAGTVVTLAATPDTGFTFAGWSGACSGTGSCVITMDSDKTVTATFNLKEIVTWDFNIIEFGEECYACTISIKVENTTPGATVLASSSWGASDNKTANSAGTATLLLTTPVHCPCLSGSFTVSVGGTQIFSEYSDCF